MDEKHIRTNLDEISNDLQKHKYKSIFNPQPLDYSIDETKAKEYVKGNNDPTQAQQILGKTKHITIREFDKHLEECLDRFLQAHPNKPMHIFWSSFDPFIIKSNQWVIAKCWHKIKHFGFVSKETNGEVVVFDDCIYSGLTILSYLLQSKKANKVHIICPYVTQHGLDLIANLIDKYRLPEYTVYYLTIVDHVNRPSTITDLQLPYATVYFDHRIADKASTFTDMYCQIVKNVPTRSYLECMEHMFKT